MGASNENMLEDMEGILSFRILFFIFFKFYFAHFILFFFHSIVHSIINLIFYLRYAGFWNFMSRLQFNSGNLRCLDLSNIRLNQQLYSIFNQSAEINIFSYKKESLKCPFFENELEKLNLCSIEHIPSSKNGWVRYYPAIFE